MDPNEELRKAVQQYFASQQPPKPQQPDAPGFDEKDRPELRDKAATVYGQSILDKPAGAITPYEKEWLRKSILGWTANRD